MYKKYFVFCREREREHQRQELWNKVETLASSKSELELNRSISGDFNSMTSSPDPDSEGGLDNADQDSTDVSTINNFENILPLGSYFPQVELRGINVLRNQAGILLNFSMLCILLILFYIILTFIVFYSRRKIATFPRNAAG